MLIGELEYDDMVENNADFINGPIVGKILNNTEITASLTNVKIDQEPLPLPFIFTDHLFIAVFVFFMSIIMINLLFGLAVSDVQVCYT